MRGNFVGVALATAVGLLATGSAGGAEDRNQTVLTEIRPETTDRATRLTVEATAALTYTYYSPDPLTLVIDIPEADSTKVPAKVNVASPEVESVRVTSLARADGHSLTRIEIRLASLSPYHIFARDSRLTVEFDRASGRAAASQPATPSTAAGAPAPSAAAAPVAPAPEVSAAPASAPAVVAASSAATTEQMGGKRRPATAVRGVTHREEEGQLAITVAADGALSYEDFVLANPFRLVVDFSNVNATRQNVTVGKGPVRRVRLAQFSTGDPRVARMVVDLDRRMPYRIVDASDGVKILIDESGAARPTSTPEPLAALRPAPEAAALPAAAGPTEALETSAAPVLVAVPTLAAEPPAGSSAFRARSVGAEEKKYTGAPISMNFKDGDLQDIFRLFADISGLNIVVNPGVSGKVTLVLTEVPWDQALDVILKVNGLGMRLEDNVIRIAKLSDLQKEENERRKLQDEAELAGDLVERLRPISYARAKDLADVLKKSGALSRRGSIYIDERTNTIILKDLPRFLNKSVDLINELDRATRQVEIEARVVVTTRNFARDVGVQWGFLNQQSPQFGNQLSRAFPNTVSVGGRGTEAGTTAVGGSYVVNLPATAPTSGVGVSMGNILGSFNLDAALTALERQGRGRILSTPKITTQDNQEATIKQGLQFPIQVEMNNTITVQYKDATLTLKVTPQITEANTVILHLTLENNAADFTRTVDGIPSIQVQEAKTVLLVNDGDTAVVGGVYKSQEDYQNGATPFLSRIPLLGYLFQERSVSQQNQELLLFITPHITKG